MLVLHGGAGRVPERDAWRALAESGLRGAAEAGGEVLAAGGEALDAVAAAVRVLEDCTAFNAGQGSVCNADGDVEMDAAVMRGLDAAAGAVAGLRDVRHPVDAARAVLDDGRHVLLAGEGAARLARARDLERIDAATLRAAAPAPGGASSGGTVGAVALDRDGRLAAATSTGGTAGKRPGRISDSAVVGAGTWADERCAVSTTGQGEAFLRCAFAHAVAARVESGEALDLACGELLLRVATLGGEGGCIAVDGEGRVAMPCDTPAMPRAILREGRELAIWIERAARDR